MLAWCLLTLLPWVVTVAGAQTGGRTSPARGVLLVAEPGLADHRFERSVVLLLHHDNDGSLGLIVNRPTAVRAREALADAAELRGYDERVFVGGPVAPTAIAVLSRHPRGNSEDGGTPAILDGVYVSSDLALLADPAVRAAPDRVRLYAGHAAWQGGQLEQEIAGGAWRAVPGHARHVFSTAPLTLWEQLSAGAVEISVQAADPAGVAPERLAGTPALRANALRLLR